MTVITDRDQFSSIQFSRSVMSDSLQPHELQHTRPPCPSPIPRVHPDSCSLFPPAAWFSSVAQLCPISWWHWGNTLCKMYPVLVQFSSVTQSCLTLCDPMNRSTPGLPVHHQLPEFTQTHVHQVGDAIQPSHPLPPTPPCIRVFSNESGPLK